MLASPTPDAATAINALIGWWDLAGVETWVNEDPTDWTATRPVAGAQSAPPSPALPLATGTKWPDNWEEFQAWLAGGTDMPEASWTGPVVSSTGAIRPRLMVVLDMPGDGGATLLTPEADRLLDGMLRAMGLTRADAHVASLAVRRPPGGLLPAETIPPLAERMRHHIALAQPDALLIMGDGTKRALAPTNASETHQYLQTVNHRTGTVKAVATFHPQLILSQAAAKSECWRALQSLVGGE